MNVKKFIRLTWTAVVEDDNRSQKMEDRLWNIQLFSDLKKKTVFKKFQYNILI